MADFPLAQENKHPPHNEYVITEVDNGIVPVEVAQKPSKQQRRGGETDLPLLALLIVIKKGPERTKRKLTRLKDGSASKSTNEALVKEAD